MEVYENLRDTNGDLIRGRTKLFVESIDESGNVLNYQVGDTVNPDNSGFLYIVDEWAVDQVHKLKVVDGDLVVKEGETVDSPEKTEKEVEREQLLARLAELDDAI